MNAAQQYGTGRTDGQCRPNFPSANCCSNGAGTSSTLYPNTGVSSSEFGEAVLFVVVVVVVVVVLIEVRRDGDQKEY